MPAAKLVGRDLFYKRIEKGMKQEVLCSGICSVSYLSKIENNKIVPSEEILNLLCERLGIAPESIADIEADVKQKLDQWHAHLIQTEREAARQLYEELQRLIPRLTDSELLNYYHVLQVRYYILIRNLEGARCLVQDLKKAAQRYSPFHLMLYTYLCGLLHCFQGEWEKGAVLLTEAERQAKQLKYFEAGIYYNLALCHSQTENIYKALYFSQIAMDGFRNDCKFRNIVDCQIIMAINYTRLGEYERALQTYENILQAIKSFANQEQMFAIVYHNMGHVYQHKKEPAQAIELYLKSLQFKCPETNTYLTTLRELVEQYLMLEQPEEAKDWIEKGLLSAAAPLVEKKWLYVFQMFYHKYFDHPQEYRRFLERRAIPFFKSTKKWNELKKTYLELAEYFENVLEYKESTRYYKLAVQILKDKKGE